MNRRIGILSGMGAAAGAWLLTHLIRECQDRGVSRDSDFPEIVLFSMASKGLDETGVADESIIIHDLCKGLNLLNAAGVETIIIACNSVHKYYEFLQIKSKARIINMPECAQQETKGRAGVLCSRTTRDSGLYHGLQTTDEEQVVVDRLIGEVISGKNRSQSPELSDIADRLIERGADSILIGCTELSMIAPAEPYIVDAGIAAIREALS